MAWIKQPREIPSVVRKEALRPRISAFLVTRAMSAPGVTVRSAAMLTKAKSRESSIVFECTTIIARNQNPGTETAWQTVTGLCWIRGKARWVRIRRPGEGQPSYAALRGQGWFGEGVPSRDGAGRRYTPFPSRIEALRILEIPSERNWLPAHYHADTVCCGQNISRQTVTAADTV